MKTYSELELSAKTVSDYVVRCTDTAQMYCYDIFFNITVRYGPDVTKYPKAPNKVVNANLMHKLSSDDIKIKQVRIVAYTLDDNGPHEDEDGMIPSRVIGELNFDRYNYETKSQVDFAVDDSDLIKMIYSKFGIQTIDMQSIVRNEILFPADLRYGGETVSLWDMIYVFTKSIMKYSENYNNTEYYYKDFDDMLSDAFGQFKSHLKDIHVTRISIPQTVSSRKYTTSDCCIDYNFNYDDIEK